MTRTMRRKVAAKPAATPPPEPIPPTIMKGKKDPYNDDSLLVPVTKVEHPSLPRLMPSMNFMDDIYLCKCKTGVQTDRSVEYIYDKAAAIMAGEEWGINHPNYNGTLRNARKASQAQRKPSWELPPVKRSQPARKAETAAQDPAPGRRMRRKTQDTPLPEDQRVIDTGATEMSERLVQEMQKRTMRRKSREKDLAAVETFVKATKPKRAMRRKK